MNRPEDERRERELAALDSLLDEQPVPEVPAGLAERVLAYTSADRAVGGARGGDGVARPRPVLRWAPLGGGLAAAAALLLWLGGAFGPRGDTGTLDGIGDRVARAPVREADAPTLPGPVVPEPVVPEPAISPEPPAVPDELLRELDLLEDWELLVTEDLDLLLAELDDVDEVLLATDEEGLESDGRATAGEQG